MKRVMGAQMAECLHQFQTFRIHQPWYQPLHVLESTETTSELLAPLVSDARRGDGRVHEHLPHSCNTLVHEIDMAGAVDEVHQERLSSCAFQDERDWARLHR